MFQKTRSMARKYGARLVAVPATALASFGAFAQETGPGADILAKVTAGMSQGEKIAAAVVLGLFVIWIVKLLWRSK